MGGIELILTLFHWWSMMAPSIRFDSNPVSTQSAMFTRIPSSRRPLLIFFKEISTRLDSNYLVYHVYDDVFSVATEDFHLVSCFYCTRLVCKRPTITLLVARCPFIEYRSVEILLFCHLLARWKLVLFSPQKSMYMIFLWNMCSDLLCSILFWLYNVLKVNACDSLYLPQRS